MLVAVFEPACRMALLKSVYVRIVGADSSSLSVELKWELSSWLFLMECQSIEPSARESEHLYLIEVRLRLSCSSSAEWSLSMPWFHTLQSLTLFTPFRDTDIESSVSMVGGEVKLEQ